MRCLLFCSVLITDYWNKLSWSHVPLFCSYHILTSHVIYYWTDEQQYGIYLLNRQWKIIVDLFTCFGINLLPSSLVVNHQLFTSTCSIVQQENGFLLCCVKLGENNFNKRSSCHKKYWQLANGKLTTLSTLNF